MDAHPRSPVLDLLLTRRSVKAGDMIEPGPDEATLQQILRAGIRVPDHGKLGPWRFMVIRGAARDRLGEAIAAAFQADSPEARPEDVAYERGRIARAPVVVAVACRINTERPIPEWEQVMSCGAACQNLLVATHASGFVAQWLTEWYAYDERVKAALGLGPEDRIAGFVYMGSAREAPRDRPRPDYDTVVSEWTGE